MLVQGHPITSIMINLVEEKKLFFSSGHLRKTIFSSHLRHFPLWKDVTDMNNMAITLTSMVKRAHIRSQLVTTCEEKIEKLM